MNVLANDAQFFSPTNTYKYSGTTKNLTQATHFSRNSPKFYPFNFFLHIVAICNKKSE